MIVKNNKGEDIELQTLISERDVRNSGKAKVISYDGCKKIADGLGICVKDAQMVCTPTKDNLQQHIWWVRVGFIGCSDKDNWVFSEWEANQLNTGDFKKKPDGTYKYVEFTEIDAQYRNSMAYKRAYCRAVLRRAGLIGIYADVEAKAFKAPEGAEVETNYSEW